MIFPPEKGGDPKRHAINLSHSTHFYLHQLVQLGGNIFALCKKGLKSLVEKYRPGSIPHHDLSPTQHGFTTGSS